MQSSHTSPHTHNPYAEFTHLIHHTHRTAKQSSHTSPPHTAQNSYTQFTHIQTTPHHTLTHMRARLWWFIHLIQSVFYILASCLCCQALPNLCQMVKRDC